VRASSCSLLSFFSVLYKAFFIHKELQVVWGAHKCKCISLQAREFAPRVTRACMLPFIPSTLPPHPTRARSNKPDGVVASWIRGFGSVLYLPFISAPNAVPLRVLHGLDLFSGQRQGFIAGRVLCKYTHQYGCWHIRSPATPRPRDSLQMHHTCEMNSLIIDTAERRFSIVSSTRSYTSWACLA